MSKDDFKNPNELRRSFLDFAKKHGAAVVASASLLPENDPSTLFTGSGMQPMVPYLLGEKHPAGRTIANVQKCVRTVDIDAVGDNSHLTFFEMIGRWELGANTETYKQRQIKLIWDWQIHELGIDPNRFYVSVYRGSDQNGIPKDSEAIETWSELFRSVGIEPLVEDDPFKFGCSRGGRIFVYGDAENWWSRAGLPDRMPLGEPGGPDSEMFFDFDPKGDSFDHPATDTPRFLEIGNNVFMSFKRVETGFCPLSAPNIDYGGGLERIAAAVNGDPDVYKSAFFLEPVRKLESLSGISYLQAVREFRIILDHARASTFLIGDGALPSNADAGYVTRRLLRRAIRMGRKLEISGDFLSELAYIYIAESTAYPELAERQALILDSISKEETLFRKTLQSGEREMKRHLDSTGSVSGRNAYYFYETFGFPRELTEEFLVENNQRMVDPESFELAAQEHSEKSRTASAGKFRGGLADTSEKTTALHTTTHLLLAGLRSILGEHVHQKGSNITPERIRFDFNHPEKTTEAQKQAVEDYVNEAIRAGAVMSMIEMPKLQAKESGVEGSFWEKYPETVKVYLLKDASGRIWSQELCGGPHLPKTSDIASFGRFKILKEESISSGVRRIKAVLLK